MRRLFADMGHVQQQPTVCFEDNTACEKLCQNYCGHDRVKHLDVRSAVVREHHAKGYIDIVHVPDPEQLADLQTKVKPGPQTTAMRNWALRGELPAQLSIQPHLRNACAG